MISPFLKSNVIFFIALYVMFNYMTLGVFGVRSHSDH